MSVTTTAARPGPCFSCDFGIRPGQLIRPNRTAVVWEHVQCPSAPEVCMECFTEVARNGSCLCGVI